jgi:hypothetical protein
MSRTILGRENKTKEVLGGMAQATAENLLIKMVKEEKGRTRLTAMRWLLLLQGKLTAQELGIDLDAASDKEQSALAGMIRKEPANERETDSKIDGE